MRCVLIISLLVLFWNVNPSNVSAQSTRTVPDSVATNLKQQEDFRYANDPKFWERKKQASNAGWLKFISAVVRSPVTRFILYVLGAALVVFVIVKVIQVNGFFELRRKRQRGHPDEDESMIPADLEALLQNALSTGDLRLAVRLYYLQTLQRLERLNKITLQAKSTNQDYLKQMDAQPEAGTFRQLTRIYEFVWYGEFQPSTAQFQAIRNGFTQFNERG